jgi:RNA polymerase sigma-70 factor (ECF subfamily)
MTGKILHLERGAAAAPAPEHDDDAWMILARSGRPGAFDALVRRHQGAALGVAHRYLGDRDLACDAVQNAFVEVYQRLPDYRPEGHFRAYLHRILLNQCRMAVRSRGIRARFADRLARRVEDDAPAAALPDAELLARDRDRRVDRAVLDLSDKLRAVVALHYAAELPLAEIADVLGLSPGTVKSRLAAALAKLRGALEGS